LLKQSLLGTWAIRLDGEPESAATQEYVERIQTYMAKALHEAKINTSWIQPNEEWDAAMQDFVAKILDPSPRNKFVPAFLPVAKQIAHLGAINSLSQTLLKLTSPGVPDIYQGNEIWDYSLVDPDNRRPVDYNLRREMLDALQSATPNELMRTWPDGRVKMFLTQRVLRFRREHADIFQSGDYLPLRASGTFAECCISFIRSATADSSGGEQLRDKWIGVIAPRLSARVGFPPIGELWKDTIIEFPETLSLENAHDLFTCHPIPLRDRQANLADALSVLPFAVITNLG
jgi:(1->4)-alpha-D-glucan 1-alpha-D-glucosylmutase